MFCVIVFSVSAAGEPAAPPAAPQASEASAPPASAAPQPRATALEQRIALLTAELDLDTQQQDRVRRILEDQRQQISMVWSDSSLAAANRVNATRVISDRTADRIRAILNEEQKSKYNQARKPHLAGETAASPSLDEWMKAVAAKQAGQT
jgi:hypothetical protein